MTRSPMLVMPSNNTCYVVHYLAGRYGGLAHLLTARPPMTDKRGRKKKAFYPGPFPHLPYAIDNGAYSCFQNGYEWDEKAFVHLLEWSLVQRWQALWVTVPDVVMNGPKTIERYREWAPRLKGRFRIAIACQDGMTPDLVTKLDPVPDCFFIGGSKRWKFESLPEWCAAGLPVHVGRVNGRKGLDICYELGVVSCDGTGWFRGRQQQLVELESFLKMQSDLTRPDIEMAVASRVGRTRGPVQHSMFD